MTSLRKLIDAEKCEYDWKKIWKIPEFAKLRECQQSPRWHKEGNVDKHVEMVCNEAIKVAKEMKDNDFRLIFLAAALFHDIGKGVTTKIRKDGNWHAYNHEVESEVITRRLLADEDEKFRETICALVRWHMEPLRIYEHRDVLEHIVLLSREVNIAMLCLLKRCDIGGSIAEDKQMQEIDYLKLAELQSIASRLGCLQGPSTIPMKGEYQWLVEKNLLEEERKNKQ